MLRLTGRAFLAAFRWRLVAPPRAEWPRRFVFIAAPHTSSWDFPFMMATAWALSVRIRWLGKHTLFEGPFGWFFRALGGIPVDRRSPQNLVEQTVARFAREEDLVLAVAAEGTRRRVDRWRSGFYAIALGARVPVGLGFLDFGTRRCGLGGFLHLTGDVRADMDAVRAFYATVRGRHPELAGPPRLREEDAANGDAGVPPAA